MTLRSRSVVAAMSFMNSVEERTVMNLEDWLQAESEFVQLKAKAAKSYLIDGHKRESKRVAAKERGSAKVFATAKVISIAWKPVSIDSRIDLGHVIRLQPSR